MSGVLINGVTIAIMGILGSLIGGKIPDRARRVMMEGIGLSVLFLGIQMALNVQNLLIVIISIILGGAIGGCLGIQEGMDHFGETIDQKYFAHQEQTPMAGFIDATILFCAGSMGVIGAIQAGTTGDISTLVAKSALDGTVAMIFASTMGIGVAFSGVSVFLYEGGIVLISSLIAPLITETMISDISAVGGLIIMAIGLGIMEIKKIPVANFLPGIFLPPLLHGIMTLLPGFFS